MAKWMPLLFRLERSQSQQASWSEVKPLTQGSCVGECFQHWQGFFQKPGWSLDSCPMTTGLFLHRICCCHFQPQEMPHRESWPGDIQQRLSCYRGINKRVKHALYLVSCSPGSFFNFQAKVLTRTWMGAFNWVTRRRGPERQNDWRRRYLKLSTVNINVLVYNSLPGCTLRLMRVPHISFVASAVVKNKGELAEGRTPERLSCLPTCSA